MNQQAGSSAVVFRTLRGAKAILMPIGFVAVYLLAELLLRSTTDLQAMVGISETAIIAFLIGFVVQSSNNTGIACLTAALFAVSVLTQWLHFEYYGFWMSAHEWWLLFEKPREVMDTAAYFTSSIALPLIVCLVPLLFCSLLIRSRVRSRKLIIADILGLLIILVLPIRAYYQSGSSIAVPQTRYSSLKAGLYSYGYFFGRTLPGRLFKLDSRREYRRPKPEFVTNPGVRNIIFVVGESLNTVNLSYFSYSRDTTPWIDSFTETSPAVVKKTYAAGVFTDVSLPSIFNAIPQPDGTMQISSGNTNLFRLAKEAGFSTHLYSSQASDTMAVTGAIGREWIDTFKDSRALGHDDFSSAFDEFLLDYLDDVDLEQSNFVVLHQIGSHSPYIERTPSDFRPFGIDRVRDRYDNTVAYTDALLRQVVERLTATGRKDWILIFTSDHGQAVNDNAFGHGSLGNLDHYLVPTLVFSPKAELQHLYREEFGNCQEIFHIQVSELIMRTLGYQSQGFGCQKGVVNGPFLDGSAGIKEITLQ